MGLEGIGSSMSFGTSGTIGQGLPTGSGLRIGPRISGAGILGTCLLVACLSLIIAGPVRAGDAGLADLATGEVQNFIAVPSPQPVPELALVGPDGEAASLEDFRGRVVLLNFWATWCAPCIHEMPALDRLQAALGGDEFTVLVASVDRGGLDVAAPFLEELGIEHLQTHIDPAMAGFRALGGKVMPTTLLLDAQGRELGRLEGPAEWDAPEAQALIRAAIAAPGS